MLFYKESLFFLELNKLSNLLLTVLSIIHPKISDFAKFKENSDSIS